MKRLLSAILVLGLILGLLPSISSSVNAASDLPPNAVGISSVEELDMICYEYPADGYYYLTCDIDMTTATSRNGDFYNDGLGWEPHGTQSMPFTGTLDGCGYSIIGLNIARPTVYHVGLFGYCANATIKNIVFQNCNVTGNNYTGLIGRMETGVVENVQAIDCTIVGKNYVGSLVGCATNVTVTGCKASGTVTGTWIVGGLCGTASKVLDCENHCNVSGECNTNEKMRIGGICGEGNVERCINFGEIHGNRISSGGSGTSVCNDLIAGISAQGNALLCANIGPISGEIPYVVSVGGNYTSVAMGVSGIIGTGNADRCYNAGTISGGNAAKGAILGYYYGTVSNSYNTYNGDYFMIVPLVCTGFNRYESAKCINCYNIGYTVAESSRDYSTYKDNTTDCFYVADYEFGCGTLVTPRQLRIQSTFKNWDFDEIWTMGGNEDYLYPELQGLPMIFEKSLTGITMATDPVKLNYLEAKEELDLTGAQINLKYDNDTTEKLAITADMVSGFDNTKVGKQTITVTYEGFTTSFDITIIAKSLTSIVISSLPKKLTFLEGRDALDVSGGVLTLFYNNGTTAQKDMQVSMVSGFDNSIAGMQELTVTYGSKTTTYDVEIIAKTLIGIEVSKLPTKVTYLEGKDTLNLSGGKLSLIYDNDQTIPINLSEATVTGFSNKKVGIQTLTVYYRGFTATFQVEVVAKQVDYIVLAAEPAILTYLEGKDSLNVTGGMIRVFYNNDTEDTIPMTIDMVSGFDNSVVGLQTLLVTYQGKTAVYEVEIIAKKLTGMEIKDLPAKLVYRENKDNLNLTGGRLTLYYNNGTSEVVNMTLEMVTGFDNSKIGNQTLTVNYLGMKAEFSITVVDDSYFNPFTDVKPGQWYTDAVMWAYENDITKGMSDTLFGLNEPCTRVQVVTFLWRAAGCPAPKSAVNPFTDVKAGKYYTDAILWAVENGITSGMTPTTFGLNEPCTRIQVVTFLWRAAGKPAPTSTKNPFKDVKAGKYYTDAVLWAYENSITSGMTSTTFGITNPCTRAQVVTFLYRSQG